MGDGYLFIAGIDQTDELIGLLLMLPTHLNNR